MISAKVVRKLTELVADMESDGFYELRIRVDKTVISSTNIYISNKVRELNGPYGENDEFQLVK